MDNISKNKYRLMAGVITLSFSLFFASCAQNKEYMRYTNDQIGSLKKRTEALENNTGSKIDNIVSTQASLMADIESLRSEMRALTGRIEETEYLVKRNMEKELGDSNGGGSIAERLNRLEKMVKEQQRYLGMEPFVTVPSEGAASSGGFADLDNISMENKPKDEALYDSSLLLYKRDQFKEALGGFRSFLAEYPKSELADNAQFWIGECYMSMGQYKEAAIAFDDVIKKYPDANKVPGAYLRQAIAWQELDDITMTKLLLNKLIKAYPGTPEAKRAEEILAKL
ncbi:MAG: tol-pal system protein YbgF [Deltaproteobacteria bacterium]|nr:tol-pal system protein YbgF [Deltaproteobacteria bacterium]